MKKIFTFLITSVLIINLGYAQTFSLVGDALTGNNSASQELKYTEISADASTVITGSSQNAITVYENDGSDNWVQIGETFVDAGNSRILGECAINANGDIIAFRGGQLSGADEYVCVFQRSGDSWQLMGDTIRNETDGTTFGYALAIDYSGYVLAVASVSENGFAGSVRVYQFANDAWSLKGDVIYGESGDRIGSDIDITADGNTFIVGADYNGTGGTADVFTFTDSAWVRKGTQLLSDNSSDNYGYAVSINYDGSIIAIGAPESKDANNELSDVGKVKVYEFSGNDWVQVGEDFYGNSAHSKAGASVSLNAAGDLVAVGSPGYALAGGTEKRGRATVLKQYNGIWRPYGNEELPGYAITGNAADGDEMGTHVSLDSIGSSVVISSPGRDIDGNENCGVVEVFRHPLIGSTTQVNYEWEEKVSLFPTLVSDFLFIHAKRGAQMEIFNSLGIRMYIREIFDEETKIDLSSFKSGVYYIRFSQGMSFYSTSVIKK